MKRVKLPHSEALWVQSMWQSCQEAQDKLTSVKKEMLTKSEYCLRVLRELERKKAKTEK
jgi:hypothetical protein